MIRYETSTRDEFMRDYYYHYFFLAHKHLSEQGLGHFQDGQNISEQVTVWERQT